MLVNFTGFLFVVCYIEQQSWAYCGKGRRGGGARSGGRREGPRGLSGGGMPFQSSDGRSRGGEAA